MNLKAVVEGLLFVAGDEGLTRDRLISLLEIDSSKLDEILDELSLDYSSDDRGLLIGTFGDRYKLFTKKKHAIYYKKLLDGEVNEKLSSSALETLAIIAYNQPITRLAIDEIRGVSSAHIVRKLVVKNLIEEVGRSDLPGRPILYGVTEQFLDHFGLQSLEDLPSISINESDEERELYVSKYSEE